MMIEIIKNSNVNELKEMYLSHLDEFMIMRNKEYEGEILSEAESQRYVYLVDRILKPLQEKLDELGESEWVDHHAFDYEY
jgi:hypothetical protein